MSHTQEGLAMPPEIRAFFESYRDAFNALDGHAVAQFYAEPSGIAQDGVYTFWPDRQPVAQNMSALCKIYQEKDFVRAEFEPCQFFSQGDKYAVADIQWRIDWSADQEPWRFKTTYNLVRTAEGWKVLLCTAYSEAALHKTAGAA
jgi:ketosteroid isomerase-like protein